jgi:hypothetical protein
MNLYKKNTFLKIFLLIFFVIGFFSTTSFVFALETEFPEIFGVDIGEGTLPEYARYFFNIGIFISITLAGIVIAFGGIYYLIDFARGKFANEGKEWIKAGVAGLLLTTCAYLIAFTINPSLVIFDFKGLAPLTYIANILNPPNNPNLPIDIYNEIPIGTLTENLLSRTMDCYDFDSDGNPIAGEKIKTDENKEIIGPTYLEHDRVDCALKLSQAIDKKAEAVEKLSDEIVSLMNSCNCASIVTSLETSLNNSSDILVDREINNSKDLYFASLTVNNSSSGDGYCLNRICSKTLDKSKGGTTDCKSSISCTTSNDYDKYKKYIGKTNICKDSCYDNSCECSAETCDRCPEGYKEKIDHGPIEIESCDGKKYRGLDEFKSEYSSDYELIKKQIEIYPAPKVSEKEITVIKQDEWKKLTLRDQLVYLKGKIEKIKLGVEADINNLKKAENELGGCYLADSYVDFLKTYETTLKTNKTILVKQSYSDPSTNKLINPAKYCEGFQYNNSTCYSQCNKMCPGNQARDFTCYLGVIDCSDKNGIEKESCLKEQTLAYKECFNNSSCLEGAGSFLTFGECFSTCQQNCLDSCDKLCLAEEKSNCQKKCNEDSKCLIENIGTCLINFEKMKSCIDNYRDVPSIQKCVEGAERCPYCSDQYAGYSDCLKAPYSTNGDYSTSYFYQNKNLENFQICKNPYEMKTIIKNGVEEKVDCITLYPETTKCPASSKCPDCPCDIVSSDSSSAYRVCSGVCDEFSYNDDPLTFYCNQSWWTKESAKKENPIGEERLCLKSKEIPVGQTVDDAENWGQKFLDQIKNIANKTSNMISHMEDVAEQKNYCQCDSKCDDAGKEPTCQDKCIFQATDATEEESAECWCEREGCSGNPCQKLINILKGKKASESCPKGVEYKGTKYYHTGISGAKNDFYNFVILSGRTDIVKKLNYSRDTINNCSITQNNYGEKAELLSCTRVEDEIISPIVDNSNKTILNGISVSSYCYGKELGIITKTSSELMDNWFCCELRQVISK